MAESARTYRAAWKTVTAAILCAAMICAASPARAQTQPAPEVSADLSRPVNDFGFRLLRTLTDGRGRNVIVSPLSVSLAIAIAYNGAAGDTRTAIAKTLGAASLSQETFNRNNRALLETIEKADPAVQMEIANALWAQSDFPISPGFLELGRNYYQAAVESLDFLRNPHSAVDTINAWVNKKTHAKIPKILKDASRQTVLVITDAVYFKGKWTVPFDKKKTEPRTFYLPGGATVNAPMMIQSGRYPYFESDEFQAIRLPYGNDRFAMYVFLPRKSRDLPGFLRSLDETHWNEWIGKLSERKGRIVLPKFESTYSERLNEALESMGMSIAFGSGADFSGIHPPPPPLLINDVEHKTYVKVDEEGTEAAAATSIGIVAMAVVVSPPPFEMVVDHPFFCAIAERQSGALLFSGVVTDPSQR